MKEEIIVDKKTNVIIDIEKYLKDPKFIALVKKYAKESEEFNKNKSKIDKEHDKIFKKVFLNKKETAEFLSKITGKKINLNELVASQNSFVTAELRYREADIVYKLKDKNIVFLIEHQTRIDFKMAYRILNYQIEIMRANENANNKKDNKECLVIPIVIYTGKKRWSAKRYIREIQEEYFDSIVKEKLFLGMLGFYALVDINDYENNVLIEDKSLLSKIMLLEKIRNSEDLVNIIFEINEKVRNYKEKDVIYDAMYLVLSRKIGEKNTNSIMEKIIKKGSDYMLAAEETMIEENRRIRAEGRKEGRIEGRIEGILQIVKEMIKNGVKSEDIMKYTNMSKKELNKIKNTIK